MLRSAEPHNEISQATGKSGLIRASKAEKTKREKCGILTRVPVYLCLCIFYSKIFPLFPPSFPMINDDIERNKDLPHLVPSAMCATCLSPLPWLYWQIPHLFLALTPLVYQ
ncbi:hypothetical protein ACTXT7_010121 [Hymenolepis weldensis]